MKNINGLVMNYDEFVDIVEKVTNGSASVANESGEWFYISEEGYDIDLINSDLSDYLRAKVDSVVIDLTKDKNGVVIIYG